MRRCSAMILCIASLIVIGAIISAPSAQGQSIDAMLADGFSYRNLGPYRVGTWVTDLAVPEAPSRDHLYTLYVATRNGGVAVTITDAAGEEATTLNGSGRAGVNEVNWRLDPTSREGTPPGQYTATITIGEETLSRTFDVVYP